MTTADRSPGPGGVAVPPICPAWIPLRQARNLAEVAGRRAQIDHINRALAPHGLRVAPLISMPGSRWVHTTAGWVTAIQLHVA